MMELLLKGEKKSITPMCGKFGNVNDNCFDAGKKWKINVVNII